MALVEVERAGRDRRQGRDRNDGGGPGVSYDRFVRRSPAAAGAAAGIPLRPARAAISRAAERRGGAAEGRRRRTPWRSSTTMAAGPMPISTISAAASRGCWSKKQGLIPGNRVLLRGPNGYTMFAAWLGVLKAGGVVVATMPLLRPGEIATVIERARNQPRDRRQPLHRRLPPGGRADPFGQAHRQI